jgi:putative membrane protein
MLKNKVVKGVLGVSALAALFAALAVQAQTAGSSQPATGQTAQTSSSTRMGGAAMIRADQKMIKDMAMANMAEIEAGRMAQSKSQNEQVKNFAQQMITDHSKALEDVRQLAQSKGVPLPTELDRIHKRKAERLGALAGDEFDRTYMARAGVADHKKTHDMLARAQTRAKDPELKALVARTLPIVDQHLKSATQLHDNTARGSSQSQGTTGASPDRK